AAWRSGSPSFTLVGPNGLHAVINSHRGNPTITATGPGAGNVYLVRVGVPRSLAIYMPTPQEGTWRLETAGGVAVGVRVQGNKPRPTLTVAAPGAGQTLHATVKQPVQTLRGTLQGAAAAATVTLFAGPNGCRSSAVGAPVYTGLIIAHGVQAGGGSWRY